MDPCVVLVLAVLLRRLLIIFLPVAVRLVLVLLLLLPLLQVHVFLVYLRNCRTTAASNTTATTTAAATTTSSDSSINSNALVGRQRRPHQPRRVSGSAGRGAKAVHVAGGAEAVVRQPVEALLRYTREVLPRVTGEVQRPQQWHMSHRNAASRRGGNSSSNSRGSSRRGSSSGSGNNRSTSGWQIHAEQAPQRRARAQKRRHQPELRRLWRHVHAR